MRKNLSIVLCGQAGQGIQTVEYLLKRIFKLAGYNVFATKEYMSRIRDGINSTEIRVSSGPVRACVNRIDILIPLNKFKTFEWFKKNTYNLDDSYNPTNRNEALKKATENRPFPLGIFYITPDKRTFEENISIYKENQNFYTSVSRISKN
jgi:Pyruvate/2-oxoacid:ferredoxin oxidoreductase gamma subunit